MGLRVFGQVEGLDGAVGGPPAAALLLSNARQSGSPAIDRTGTLLAGIALSTGRHLRSAHDAIETRWERWDLVPDLAEDIGSRRWLRGAGTMLGLGLLAMSFWPSFSPVEAATALPPDSASRDQFRSQMIMPLAYGGETGSRMAPAAMVRPLMKVPERQRIAMTATLGAGDSLSGLLQRIGAEPTEAGQAAGLALSAVQSRAIPAGTRVSVSLGPRVTSGGPRTIESVGFRATFDLDLKVQRKDGALVLERHPIAVDATPLRISGVVGPGLYRSARAAGAPAKSIQQYLEALYARSDLDGEIAAGDRFDMVISYRRNADGGNEAGDLIYARLERSAGSRIELMRWKDGQLLDAGSLAAPASSRLFAPVNGRMTSGYGLRRHPILGYVRMHAGIDFGAAWGSPIFAVSSGTVVFAGRHGGHGNYVKLDHGGGLGTGYGHMSRIAVSPGTRVQAGQVIGYVGSSGLSTGPHLHYELYRNGQTVNPASVTFMARAAVDQKEAAAFKARLAAIKAVPSGKALKPLGLAKP